MAPVAENNEIAARKLWLGHTLQGKRGWVIHIKEKRKRTLAWPCRRRMVVKALDQPSQQVDLPSKRLIDPSNNQNVADLRSDSPYDMYIDAMVIFSEFLFFSFKNFISNSNYFLAKKKKDQI
jgi:hypothetical protein